MQRWRFILFNTVFALNCLLVFLLIFENSIVAPPWIQTIGRMHPLVLHFPIVLLILAACFEVATGFRKTADHYESSTAEGFLLAAAFTAVLSALTGLLLSKEDGYTQEIVSWHKWGGVAISLLAAGWYGGRHLLRRSKPVLAIAGLLVLGLVIITGHLGADITHGENFLLAPVTKEQQAPSVLLEDAEVYANMVQPILKSKCTGCHNPQKAKGELIMEPIAALLKGGKSGRLWDATASDLGLMLRRIHLPLENKKHMPPSGKPQLNDTEIAILYYWIKGGAGLHTKVAKLPVTDSLHILAASMFNTIETDAYSFEPADEKKVAGLSNNYRLVTPLATGSPALGVEFFGASHFEAGQLKELLAVKNQIVSLNLNKMPVTDADLSTIAQFTNLRKLNLSFTNIKGTGLAALTSLKELKQLSVSGTGVTAANLTVLASLPQLTKLYTWSTPAQVTDQLALQKQFKHTTIESGFSGDTIILKLNPPLVENEEQILLQSMPLKLKHYVKGVSIHYTTDGTEPDSIISTLYKDEMMLDKNLLIKARAFKPGWVSSDVTEKTFYKAGFKIDSIRLMKPAPDAPYKAYSATILADNQKGDFNFGNGKWQGFRGKPMEAILYFNEPHEMSSVTVSTLVNIDGYIMPPQQVELWAGSDPAHLKLVKKIVPEQPSKTAPAYMKGYELGFKTAPVKCFKLVLVPVAVLPAWHPGKGDRGWVFADEIFCN